MIKGSWSGHTTFPTDFIKVRGWRTLTRNRTLALAPTWVCLMLLYLTLLNIVRAVKNRCVAHRVLRHDPQRENQARVTPLRGQIGDLEHARRHASRGGQKTPGVRVEDLENIGGSPRVDELALGAAHPHRCPTLFPDRTILRGRGLRQLLTCYHTGHTILSFLLLLSYSTLEFGFYGKYILILWRGLGFLLYEGGGRILLPSRIFP